MQSIKKITPRRGVLALLALSALLVAGTSAFALAATNNPTTDPATNITQTDATLNGTNGSADAIGHSFWAATSTFSTASPTLPDGVYSTPDLGALPANASSSAALSSVSGLPAVTPNTTYYFAAWSNVDGTWYPGEVMNFTTSASSTESTTTNPTTVKVTIAKYIDGAHATAENASSTAFQMNATWAASNSAGTGQYALSTTGFNSPNAYEAVTSDMNSGASYNTSEIMDDNVGASCAAGKPYALAGYSSGDSMEAAAAAEPSQTAPALSNITSDKFIIVWNESCTSTSTANVTTLPATNITSTDATLNGLNGFADAEGHSIWASTSTYSTASPIIPSGVYSTPDLGAIASNTPFSALLSSETGMPAVTPGTTYYFNAWSRVGGTWYPGAILSFTTGTSTATSTGGTIGGDVTSASSTLQVTSVDTVKGTATADGTFANGWKYVFHITDPQNEPNLQMKFSDWINTANASSTIPVANNMRISSAQANNGGATVLLTAADTYSTPPLTMTTDLDPATPGRQVDVTVEVAVPSGSADGSYTTNYGVKTQ